MALQSDTYTTVLTTAAPSLEVSGLRPSPDETWDTMKRFSGPTPVEIGAMRQTVDVLFQRGYELVTSTYDYLRKTPETAAILGWEQGVDDEHLAERRRFFTLWLARTLSIDLGTDYARYLFQAGQIHAGHGPRRIHTPSMWVTGGIALVLGGFAGFIQKAHTDVAVVAPALSGWNKYLTLQLNQMLSGYEAAQALGDGDLALTVKAYGRARHEWGRESIEMRYRPGEPVAGVLKRLVEYAPVLREMLFEKSWQSEYNDQDLWMRVEPLYVLRGNWRVLVNGQDLRYYGGFERALNSRDTLDLFPPGR